MVITFFPQLKHNKYDFSVYCATQYGLVARQNKNTCPSPDIHSKYVLIAQLFGNLIQWKMVWKPLNLEYHLGYPRGGPLQTGPLTPQ